jgi:hypothetical protein
MNIAQEGIAYKPYFAVVRDDKRLRRNEYQKVLMHKRRLLEKKELVVAEYLMTRRLLPHERNAAIKLARSRWNDEKKRFLLTRGALSYWTKLDAIGLFWESKHRQLDNLVAAVERNGGRNG